MSTFTTENHDHSVDQSLVHRHAAEESFVTQLRQDRGLFRATARVPASHPYWGDHPAHPGSVDPVLLLEICRQVALAASHRFHSVPVETKFILSHQSIEVDGSRILGTADMAHVSVTATPVGLRHRGDDLTQLDLVLSVEHAGEKIATGRIGLVLRSPERYAALRLRAREGEPLSSTSEPAPQTTGTLAGSLSVGRGDPDNVVLLDPETLPSGVQALLHVPRTHPSIFDHPQDHLPGMLLVEGARQVAHLALSSQPGSDETGGTALSIAARYLFFGELETPVLLTASDPSPTPSGLAVEVTANQQGRTICEISLTLTSRTEEPG